MILKTFMEVSGLKKAVDVAYHLNLTVQSIYNYSKDPSSMKLKTLELMLKYLSENNIRAKITYDIKSGKVIVEKR